MFRFAKTWSAVEFLESWETEIRAGSTPNEELDVLERLNEYLDDTVPPEVESALKAEVMEASARLIRDAEAVEATWLEPTMNDRISAAFTDLRGRGVFARGNAGTTIHDGWACVGLESEPEHHLAVFFHREDIFDALRGWSLPLAFGSTRAAVESPREAHDAAVAALSALAARGVPATWSGHVLDRIEIQAFEWRQRRWTTSPPVPLDCTIKEPAREFVSVRQPDLFAVPADAPLHYEQPINGYYSSAGYDVGLSLRMRGAWIQLGGVRGQFGHSGDPHTFVRNGIEPRSCRAML